MRKLTLRKAFSFVGMAALLSLVYFTAFGASIDCTGQTNCTGTPDADSMLDGPGNLLMDGGAGDDEILENTNVGGPVEEVFGRAGDDNISIDSGGVTHAFGGDGNDSLKLAAGRPVADGGRGDDILHVTSGLATVAGHQPELRDGPGQDTILDTSGTGGSPYRVILDADNEADTVQLDNDDQAQTIVLSKDGGREVIDCGDTDRPFDDEDIVILNGNRKAVDTQGNNLLKAALRGGVAQSNCETIVP